MSAQIPKTMRALVQNEDPKVRTVAVKEVPVPEIGSNQVLVKVEYSAQNPTDWKHAAIFSHPNVINGCDYSGTIVKLGSSLTVPLQIGDKVAGVVHGGKYEDQGAFAEYVKVDSDLLFKVPEGMKMEEAATFGIALGTPFQAISQGQGLGLPGDNKVSGNPWYMIYGASSSVGLFAIQVVKALGFKVLAFCSPHSADLVKSYGADATVDYHDKEKAIAEALEITGGGAEYGMDTISEGDSLFIAIPAMGKKAKQINCLLNPSEEAKKINPDIKIGFSLLYTILGKEFDFTPLGPKRMIVPASKEDRAFAVEYYRKLPEIITKIGIKANPIVIRGTLDDVPAGFEDMKNGKVSGQKFVYKIAA